MLSRENIVKKLEETSWGIEFYLEFCRVLEVYNDLYYHFNVISSVNNAGSKLVADIAYTVYHNVDLEMLLKVYPLYVKEHVHFFIFCRNFNIDFCKLNKHLQRSIFLKNEFEENWREYIFNLVSFVQAEGSYVLDISNSRLKLKSYEEIKAKKNISLSTYIRLIGSSKYFKSEVCSDLIQYLIIEYQLGG